MNAPQPAKQKTHEDPLPFFKQLRCCFFIIITGFPGSFTCIVASSNTQTQTQNSNIHRRKKADIRYLTSDRSLSPERIKFECLIPNEHGFSCVQNSEDNPVEIQRQLSTEVQRLRCHLSLGAM